MLDTQWNFDEITYIAFIMKSIAENNKFHNYFCESKAILTCFPEWHD